MNTHPHVLRLTPSDTGRWTITTKRGTQHLLDLDAHTYTRLPVPGSKLMDHDQQPMPLTRVERWPAVGVTFFLWTDDPDHPELLEHWRQSGTIVAIERAP